MPYKVNPPGVDVSVLCGAVGADLPKFGCDSGDCCYETSYDVDFSDCSDYDDYDIKVGLLF